MTVVHPYSVDEAFRERQNATWLLLRWLAYTPPSDTWTYLHVPTPPGDAEPDAYQQALRNAFSDPEATVIVIEGDKVPTAEQVHALAACPHPWCAVDYPLWGRPCMAPYLLVRDSGSLVAVCIDHAERGRYESYHVLEDGPIRTLRWGVGEEPWADSTGLGVTKFAPSISQLALGAITRPLPWNDMDRTISEALNTCVRAHMHYPQAVHNHPNRAAPHTPWKMSDGTTVPVLTPEDLTESEARIVQLSRHYGKI